MNSVINVASSLQQFGVRVTRRRRNGYQGIDTVGKFSSILDKLRPKVPEVEVKRIDYDFDIVLKVYVEGRYIRAVKMAKTATEQQIEKRIDGLMEKHGTAPLMWPGCRKTVAKYLGCELDRDFNVWFDDMAARLSETQ